MKSTSSPSCLGAASHTGLSLLVGALLAACGSDAAPALSTDVAVHVTADPSPDVSLTTPEADTEPDAEPDTEPEDTGADTAPTDAPSDVRVDSEPADTEADADSSDASTDALPDVPPLDCATIPTFEDGHAPTQLLYVATDGSDSDGDGTVAQPYASIERAARDAMPGTAIVLRAGTYAGGESVDGLRGTAESPIWLGGIPGEPNPVLDAGGASQGLHLIRPQYLIVHDLEIRNASDNGLNADDGGEYDNPNAAHHIIFRNLLIEDIGPTGNRDCLKLSGLNDHFVLDSTFRRCGDGGSAVDHVGCHDGVLARNTFEELGSSGVQNKGGTRDIDIFWNRFENAGARPINMGGSTGLEFFRPPVSSGSPNAEATRIRVVANLIIGGETAAAFVGCVDCVFSQNTVVNPGAWPLRILQEQTSGPDGEFLAVQNGEVSNNIFYFSRGTIRTFVNVGPDTQAETFIFRNNLWFAHDAPERSAPELPAPTSDDVVGEDPGFSGDYQISAESPAAAAGTTTWARGDFGRRCFAEPPSIGVWEVDE